MIKIKSYLLTLHTKQSQPVSVSSVLPYHPMPLNLLCFLCLASMIYKSSGLVKHSLLSFLFLGKNLNPIPVFKSFKQSECSNLLFVVSDKSVNRLGYSFPRCLSSLGHFSPDTVFLMVSLNSSIYFSFLFQWWATASSIMSHWFYCRSERTGQKFGGMTNEMRSLGNGWLPYVVCFLSIKHLIATELLSRGERKIFCYFLKKMFLRPLPFQVHINKCELFTKLWTRKYSLKWNCF